MCNGLWGVNRAGGATKSLMPFTGSVCHSSGRRQVPPTRNRARAGQWGFVGWTPVGGGLAVSGQDTGEPLRRDRLKEIAVKRKPKPDVTEYPHY